MWLLPFDGASRFHGNGQRLGPGGPVEHDGADLHGDGGPTEAEDKAARARGIRTSGQGALLDGLAGSLV